MRAVACVLQQGAEFLPDINLYSEEFVTSQTGKTTSTQNIKTEHIITYNINKGFQQSNKECGLYVSTTSLHNALVRQKQKTVQTVQSNKLDPQ